MGGSTTHTNRRTGFREWCICKQNCEWLVAPTSLTTLYSPRPALTPQGPLWLPSSQHAAPKPLPPAAALAAAVREQVMAWAGARVRGEAGLDALVLAAARAEERRWVDTEAEEADLLSEIAEGIWGDLLGEAADVLLELDAA